MDQVVGAHRFRRADPPHTIAQVRKPRHQRLPVVAAAQVFPAFIGMLPNAHSYPRLAGCPIQNRRDIFLNGGKQPLPRQGGGIPPDVQRDQDIAFFDVTRGGGHLETAIILAVAALCEFLAGKGHAAGLLRIAQLAVHDLKRSR